MKMDGMTQMVRGYELIGIWDRDNIDGFKNKVQERWWRFVELVLWDQGESNIRYEGRKWLISMHPENDSLACFWIYK